MLGKGVKLVTQLRLVPRLSMHGARRAFIYKTTPGALRQFYLTGLLGGMHEILVQAVQSGIRVTNQHLPQSCIKSLKSIELLCRGNFRVLTDFLNSRRTRISFDLCYRFLFHVCFLGAATKWINLT
jgi:hypothetical protein